METSSACRQSSCACLGAPSACTLTLSFDLSPTDESSYPLAIELPPLKSPGADANREMLPATSEPPSAGETPPPSAEKPTGNGPPSSRHTRRHRLQRPRRAAENLARCKAVRYAQQFAAEGISGPRSAAQLQLAASTLRRWRRELQSVSRQETEDGLPAIALRGRPLLEVDRPTRNEVYGFLRHVTGPAIGLPALQSLFRAVPRCILADMLTRYRKVWKRRYVQHGFELTWHYAGTVWAMDFTQPLQPVDGIFPYLLAVRDLASHCQLAWRPVRSEAAEDVVPILEELFAEHGAPLVLKSDNGAGFIATLVHQTLSQAVVAQLFSPVRRPQYNGALERSNGVLKTYTQQHAVSAGHPFRWTSDDVEQARQLANTITRPWGTYGASPAEAWNLRLSIGEAQRQAFVAALNDNRQLAAGHLDLDLGSELSVADRARLDRMAISDSLQSLEYLTMKRVRRGPKKAKRRTREEVARRAAEFRGESAATSPSTTESTTSQPPSEAAPEQHPQRAEALLQAAENSALISASARSETALVNAENSTSAQPPERVSPETGDFDGRMLASEACSDILQAASGTTTAPQVSLEAVASVHGEQTFTSWLRRLITPLLTRSKMIKISH